MSQCRGATTCRIRADHQGRMYVKEFLEGRQAENQSDPMMFQQAKLAVACRPDTLVVGNSTTCTATVSPGTVSFVVQGWRTAGDSLGETHRATGDLKVWNLKPRVCGTVTVAALVGGAAQFASTHVEVVCSNSQGALARLAAERSRCSARHARVLGSKQPKRRRHCSQARTGRVRLTGYGCRASTLFCQ
jgi:hypothetical protein